MKIPGIMLSIPEKGFLLSFLSVLIFYLLGLTKFRINMYQKIFWISKDCVFHIVIVFSMKFSISVFGISFWSCSATSWFMNERGDPVSASHCSLCDWVSVSTQNSPVDTLFITLFFCAVNWVGRIIFMLAQSSCNSLMYYAASFGIYTFICLVVLCFLLVDVSYSSCLLWFVVLWWAVLWRARWPTLWNFCCVQRCVVSDFFAYFAGWCFCRAYLLMGYWKCAPAFPTLIWFSLNVLTVWSVCFGGHMRLYSNLCCLFSRSPVGLLALFLFLPRSLVLVGGFASPIVVPFVCLSFSC